jgi:hypothetical protein
MVTDNFEVNMLLRKRTLKRMESTLATRFPIRRFLMVVSFCDAGICMRFKEINYKISRVPVRFVEAFAMISCLFPQGGDRRKRIGQDNSDGGNDTSARFHVSDTHREIESTNRRLTLVPNLRLLKSLLWSLPNLILGGDSRAI